MLMISNQDGHGIKPGLIKTAVKGGMDRGFRAGRCGGIEIFM
jgi:hypothetical protein